MSLTAHPVPLTLENLKAFSPSLSHPYSAAPSSTASENDGASVFSDLHSAMSSTSSAPEDEAAPFTVQSSTGESITVYESLEQAVRYSLLRADQERRSEEESMRFAYAPLTVPASSAAPAAVLSASDAGGAGLEAGFGDSEGDGDEDEDAYFSMG
ncbi:hypothetical protein SCUP234_03138 [Seiridium cupressi]